jgi:hypothetical protein
LTLKIMFVAFLLIQSKYVQIVWKKSIHNKYDFRAILRKHRFF